MSKQVSAEKDSKLTLEQKLVQLEAAQSEQVRLAVCQVTAIFPNVLFKLNSGHQREASSDTG